MCLFTRLLDLGLVAVVTIIIIAIAMDVMDRYHHTAADTIDKLSPQQLQHCAATLGVFVYSIADLPSLLPR